MISNKMFLKRIHTQDLILIYDFNVVIYSFISK